MRGTSMTPSWRMSLLYVALASTMTLGACATDEPLAPVTTEIQDELVLDEQDAPEISDDAPGAGAAAFDRAAVSPVCGTPIDPARELVIRDLSVVEDPVRTEWTGSLTDPADGAWHLGRLLTAMAPKDQDPAVFVRNWLKAWEADRTINGFVVPARPNIANVIAAWPKSADGKLDLRKPPVRLLAIVDRFDLRDARAKNAGEGRFVFGVLDAKGETTPFTIILEYKLPAKDGVEIREWAEQWHALGGYTLGTPEYNEYLQVITDRFAKRNALPSAPNGSAINQVRTNEIALAAPWELREFRLDIRGRLAEVTVMQTPDLTLNNTDILSRFINQNRQQILAGTYEIPLKFEGRPFRAGSAINEITFFNAPGILDPQTRHIVSLNTCSGCHGGETNTIFLQINPRDAGQVAQLAGFMTGIDVSDPVTGEVRHFDDIGRRATDLFNFVCGPHTLTGEDTPPLNRVH